MKRYKGLTESRFNDLASIAFGGDGRGIHPDRLKSFEKKGLVESYEDKIYGRGNSPIDRIPMTVKKYYMPIPEHIEFCEWCAENCEDEEQHGDT